MFSSKKYSAVLVGLGRIGFTLGFDKKREQPASHTMALLDNSNIEIVAGCDSNIESANEWKKFFDSKKLNPQVFYSSKELYQKVKADIIVIAVNEKSHLEECLLAIESKPKLIILEKPVALNTAEAKKIKEASLKNEVPIMVNHERRFSEDYLTAKRFIEKIGEIQSVKAELCSGLRVYAPQFENDGSYSLIHDGTHLVDIVQYILEEDLENPTVTGIYRDEEKIVRNFTAIYSTKKVPQIEITMSGRSKFFSFGIDILGTLGRICVGNGYAKFYERKESKLYTGFYSLTNSNINISRKTRYFSNMIKNAVNFLNGKSRLLSPLDDAISDLRVLEDIKSKLSTEN